MPVEDVREVRERLLQAKASLDEVSPSFCLAKWLQVTLHLQNGTNHSCHHPLTHQTPRHELAADPGALHNTEFKKDQRALMRAGKRPAECEFCWKVEDGPDESFSDRYLKSSDPWAAGRLKEIAALDPRANVNPSYLEVSFGNQCNFRCLYCIPAISSALWSSFEKHGPYVGRNDLEELRRSGQAPLPAEGNPYIAAFWEWFPRVLPDLKVFRITGGEPLVNPNTFRLLEYLERHPQPQLQLSVNSNLGVPEPYFRKFLESLRRLRDGGQIGDFMMFTSVDTAGPHAEYLRPGLDYDLWLSRVEEYLRELPWDLTFMVTFNALSVPHFEQLLEDMLALNRVHQKRDTAGAVTKRTMLDLNHLTHPDYLAVWNLPQSWGTRLEALERFLRENSWAEVGPHGFYEYEIDKMRRIRRLFDRRDGKTAEELEVTRARFALFAKQVEAREGKSFRETFPELQDFEEACRIALAGKDDEFLRQHAPWELNLDTR